MYRFFEEELFSPITDYIPDANESNLSFLRYMVSEKCWDLVESSLPNCISQTCHLNPLLMRSMTYGIVHVIEDDIAKRLQNLVQSHWNNYHPPEKEGMHELYSSFLTDNLKDVIFSEDLTSYTFWKVYEQMASYLKNEDLKVEKEKSKIEFKKAQNSLDEIERLYKNNDFNYINKMSMLITDLNSSTMELMRILDKIKKSSINDEPEIPVNTRINRLLSVFELYLDLLERDLIDWTKMVNENIEVSRIPLIIKLLDHCKSKLDINYYSKVTSLYVTCKAERKDLIAKFIALLSETTKFNAHYEKLKISFVAESTEQFSLRLANGINSGRLIIPESLALVKKLQPSWFRIRVASNIISKNQLISSVRDIIVFFENNLSSGDNTTIDIKPNITCTPERNDKICKNKIRIANKRNCYGETKLHKLCRQNRPNELLEYLRVPGVDINVTDNCGWTPLHTAVNYKSFDCAEQILKYRLSPIGGASKLNMDAKRNDGVYPLLDAIELGDIKITKLLLSYGAGNSVLRKSSPGPSIFECAVGGEMKSLLRSWQALIETFEYLNLDDETLQMLCIIMDVLLVESMKHEQRNEDIEQLYKLVSRLSVVPKNSKYLTVMLESLKNLTSII